VYTLFLALRYLRAHRIVYWSIAAVAIGILSVIVVTSVMGGFARDIRHRIRGLASDLTVQGVSGDLYIKDYEALVRKFETVDTVVAAAPRIEWIAWRQGGSRRPFTILGIDPRHEIETSRLPEFFRAGGKKSWDFDADDPADRQKSAGIVVGRELGGFPGIRLSFVTVRDSGMTPLVLTKEVYVAGHFYTGMAEYDQYAIIMRLEEAQVWLQLGQGELPPVVNRVIVSVKDYEKNGEATRQRLLDILHANRACKDPARHALGICGAYKIETWEESRSILLKAVAVEKSIQFIILFLVVIVAGFNITSIYTLMVRSKTRDIGVMRALGGTEAGVGRVFLLCGIFCGVVGSIIGVLGGLEITWNVNELEGLMRVATRELHTAKFSDARWGAGLFGFLGLVAASLWWWRLGDPWRPSKWIWGLLAAMLGGASLSSAFGWAATYEPRDIDPALGPSTRLVAVLLAAGPFALATLLRRAAEALEGRLLGGFLHLVVALLGIVATAVTAAAVVLVFLPPNSQIFPRSTYYLQQIPTDVDPVRIVVIVAGTLLTSLLFSLYPASQASKYDPVVAIRQD
jgi:lipoprotein-releasing system permease protein